MRCNVTGMTIALKERDTGGNIKMRRILDQSLPGDRGRQHQGMQRIDVEQRIHAVLIELEKADQHQRAGEQMRDVEIDPAHQKLPDTKRSSVANSPSISAAPKYSGTRNTRILAIEVSNSASKKPQTASLPM